MPDYCSANQAELSGIKAAAETLKDYADQEIIILTDSLTSLQKLDNKIMNVVKQSSNSTEP